MSDICETDTSISIARHTVQFILRDAMNTEPGLCFGLIGMKPLSRNDSAICHAAPVATLEAGENAIAPLKNSDMQHTLQCWSEEKISVCGSYFTTQQGDLPDIDELKALDSTLRKALIQTLPDGASDPLVHLPILLNTAGCLEAFAYKIEGHALCSIPLLLAEDGQQAKKR